MDLQSRGVHVLGAVPSGLPSIGLPQVDWSWDLIHKLVEAGAPAVVLPSLFDGLMMGLGFTLVLVALGAVREIIGSGTLFANAALLLGDAFSFLELTVIPDYKGFLIMILPPGGFLALGFLLAGKRVIDTRLAKSKSAKSGQGLLDSDSVAN